MIAITSAGLAHTFALFEKIAADTYFFLEHSAQNGQLSISTAIVIDVGSCLILAYAVLMDDYGKVCFRDRTATFSVTMIIAAILPSFIAAAIQIFFTQIEMLGFSYTLSILLVSEIAKHNNDKDLKKKEETLNIRQAKVMAEQIQPHFIFNALMSIQNLCYTDGEAAAQCLEDFAGCLRGNIDALTSEEPIPFETEIEHIRQYISLEKAGTNIPFEVTFMLNITDFFIPALTVQPIAENAIKHGALSHRDGTGKVVIKSEEVGSFIRILMPKAFELFASGYIIKPVTEKAVVKALCHLRYRTPEYSYKPVRVQCFGNFEVYVNDEPVRFTRSKCKELFAYLIDRNGAVVTKDMVIGNLYPELAADNSHKSMARTALSELIKTFQQLGVDDLFFKYKDGMSVNISKVDCDYYRYLAGDPYAIHKFIGEYMTYVELSLRRYNKRIADKKN